MNNGLKCCEKFRNVVSTWTMGRKDDVYVRQGYIRVGLCSKVFNWNFTMVLLSIVSGESNG